MLEVALAGLEPADLALLIAGDEAAEALTGLSALLRPLTGDLLSLAGLSLLASLRTDEVRLVSDDWPETCDDAGLNDDASLLTLDSWLEAPLGADDPLGCDDGLARLDDASEDRSLEDCESLEAVIDEPDGLASEDFDGEPLESDDASLFEDRLSDD